MKSNWSLGRKLIVSFLGVAAITLAVGSVGYYGAIESEDSIEEIGTFLLPSVENVAKIESQA